MDQKDSKSSLDPERIAEDLESRRYYIGSQILTKFENYYDAVEHFVEKKIDCADDELAELVDPSKYKNYDIVYFDNGANHWKSQLEWTVFNGKFYINTIKGCDYNCYPGCLPIPEDINEIVGRYYAQIVTIDSKQQFLPSNHRYIDHDFELYDLISSNNVVTSTKILEDSNTDNFGAIYTRCKLHKPVFLHSCNLNPYDEITCECYPDEFAETMEERDDYNGKPNIRHK